ncbi:hypothetical protein [Baaleninema sp.]|uniref:hypothetical protein n=1 Tax=Baaleninema sp. TaxID=3101197 RepID=UPI003D037486
MISMTTLKNHPVWDNLSEGVKGIDANALVLEHLALCDYQISGYWDESDSFYENITLPRPLSPQLISSGVIFTGDKRRIQLKFTLNLKTANPPISIAELMLVYDENLELVDENWQIDLNSEFIKV